MVQPVTLELRPDEVERCRNLEGTVVRTVEVGDVLVEQGTTDGRVFVLLGGSARIERLAGDGWREPLDQCRAGAIIGELAALTGGPRTAQVTVDRPGQVLEIPSEAWTVLLASEPELRGRVLDAGRYRLLRRQLRRALAAALGGQVALVDIVEAEVDLVEVGAGERRQVPPDHAMIVVSGRLSAAGDGRPEATWGAVEGSSAISGASTTVEARATTDALVAILSREALTRIRREDPDAAFAILQALVRAEHHWRPGPATSIALVANRRSSLSDHQSLVREVSLLLDVDPVTAPMAERHLGRPSHAADLPDLLAELLVMSWFDDRYVDDDALVLAVEGGSDWWARRCCDSAEQVAVVTAAGLSPDPSLESLLAAAHRRLTVILVHPPEATAPRGAGPWIDRFPGARVLHVRSGHKGDRGRAARLLAGCAVGLALSGGGANGFAHLAVHRVLDELGVPVDVVAGTSMGAIIGSLIAADMSPDEAVEVVRARFRRLLDWTVPVVALLRGRRVTEAIDAQFGDERIEDQWRPFLCVSTDLTTSSPRVHRRGLLRFALRATVAIPGVLPPVTDEDHLLVDGGLVNNLPVEEVRELVGTGTVIAADVAGERSSFRPSHSAPAVSGWSVLAARLLRRPAPQPVPLVETLMRSLVVASSAERRRIREGGVADLYLSLDVRSCGLLEFGSVDKAVAAGAVPAGELLGDWAAASGQPWRGRNVTRT